MFKLNPVSISDNGENVRIVQTKQYCSDDINKIIIRDSNKRIIETHKVSKELILNLDINLGMITIEYYTDDILECYENLILKVTEENIEKLKTNETFYEECKQLIKEKMDFPNGTDREISYHTNLLREITINEKAKKYVLSKIKTELLKIINMEEKFIDEYTYKIYSEVYGLGAIQDLDERDDIGEIMINAVVFPTFSCSIYYIKDQIKYEHDKKIKSLEELKRIFSRVIEFSNKELNAVENAMIEATRPNGDRVTLEIPEATNNWSLNIRKFSNFLPTEDNMKKYGTINDYSERLLKLATKGFANIGIGGLMNTGKTSLINYMLTYTPKIERKFIIASVPEIDTNKLLKGHDIIIAKVDDEKGFTFSKHLRYALRSTADRIIIPEVRGAEFLEIYKANIQTQGNMFSAHAYDSESFLYMCAEMYKLSLTARNENDEAIINKISKSIDLIVIMTKIGERIVIKEITEVLVENGKFRGFNVLQKWIVNENNPLDGHYESTGNKISDKLRKKFNERGIPINELLFI